MIKHGRGLTLLVLCIAAVTLLSSPQLSWPAAAASQAQTKAFTPVILSPPDPPPGCVPFATIPADNRAVEQLVLKRLNEQRAARGLPPLTQAVE